MIVPLPACVTLPVKPPGEEVAVYERIVDPPLEVGAVKPTVAVELPAALALPTVGAPGADSAVVIEPDVGEALDVPELLVAVTAKVYEVPGAKPLTVIVPLPACERAPVTLPGVEVAV